VRRLLRVPQQSRRWAVNSPDMRHRIIIIGFTMNHDTVEVDIPPDFRRDHSRAAADSSARRGSHVSPILAALACSLLVGCAVGPDFEKPAAPAVSGYTATPLSTTVASTGVSGGEAQRFIRGSDIPGDWWTLFHSPQINALIEQSLKNNPNLKAAEAALRVAHENVLAQRGAYYPSVTAGFTASRQQQPGSLAPVPSNNALQYDLFTPQVSVSYSPDIFGLNRRTGESIQAQEQAVRFQLIAADITLSTNVVAAMVQLAALRAQIAATHQLIDSDTNIVQIVRYQWTKGYASRLDLAAQETQLAQAAATLPPLLKQLAAQRDLLAVLVGQFPSETLADNFELASLQLPQDLPVSLPSVLVAQRPDVLQAEANMHAASAQIGIAVANRLPNIQLTANAGSTALAIGQVFGPGTGFWSLAGAIAAPIFDGGTLLHQERGARAAYDQAAQQYRATVLTAFQNVADTLTALEQDAASLKAAASAADAAKLTLDLSERQYKDGYASYQALLTAQQAYQQTRIGLVQAQANRFADTAALFQALGGGWWHRTDLAGDAHEQ
jgi:NodT family efflux transporter outer membrane factor (OMF) lipoprotein